MLNQKTKKTFYFILYLIGVIAGLSVTLLATWGDLEAAFYGFDRVGGSRMSSLSCPILMSDNETSSFSIKINNSLDRNLAPSVKIDISAPSAPISSYESVLLLPGESKKLEWQIGPENIDLGRFIFARVWTYAAYPQPDREGTCGIVIYPFQISGKILTSILVALSLFGTGIGLYGLKQSGSLEGSGMKTSRYNLVAIIMFVGLINSFIGIWLIGVLVLAVSLLLGVISAGFSVKL
ncbi:MAG: hypothetical protein JNM46_03370 [Anaerolineales bacterium]|nr:hypothetical protein [Anaerolineales bacterium]